MVGSLMLLLGGTFYIFYFSLYFLLLCLELEEKCRAINWWVMNGKEHHPTSKLLPLWNRTDGDCLLDSLMQVCSNSLIISSNIVVFKK